MNQIRFRWFLTLIVLCIVGVVFSTIAIEKQIDSYIDRMKTEVNVEVINNNNNSEIVVVQEGENITVLVEDKQEEVTKTPKAMDEYVIVTSNDGLNIRRNPSVDSEKLGALNYGAKIKVIEEVGDWYRTDIGYIFKEYTIKI